MIKRGRAGTHYTRNQPRSALSPAGGGPRQGKWSHEGGRRAQGGRLTPWGLGAAASAGRVGCSGHMRALVRWGSCGARSPGRTFWVSARCVERLAEASVSRAHFNRPRGRVSRAPQVALFCGGASASSMDVDNGGCTSRRRAREEDSPLLCGSTARDETRATSIELCPNDKCGGDICGDGTRACVANALLGVFGPTLGSDVMQCHDASPGPLRCQQLLPRRHQRRPRRTARRRSLLKVA